MTTTIDQSKPTTSSRSGYTLVEMMITMSLLTMIIGVGLSSITFISRSSNSLSNYTSMSGSSRIALEIIPRDLRMGYKINSASTTKLDFDIYGKAGTSSNIILEYPGADDKLYRTENRGTKEELLEDLRSFQFNYYNLRRESTTAPISIKEVQMEGVMKKKTLVITNTNYIISARFMMRNHSVSD